MAKKKINKMEIKKEVEKRFNYNLSKTLEETKRGYLFNLSCQGSVPQAIIAFLESSNYESAIRNAISLRGDADTQAAIAGSIAESYYKVMPEELLNKVETFLDNEHIDILERFYSLKVV